MKKTTILMATAVLTLAGCSSTPDGPISTGTDTYMVGGLGGMFDHSGSVVKAKYIEQARKFCASQGKQFTLVRSDGQDAFMGAYASAEVHFACR